MCGISGFIDHKRGNSEDVLKNMIATMHHRGPDGSATWMKTTDTGTIGLSHARLAIIDLSETGNQPMHFDELSIVYNGEIYNHGETRKELEALGHSFVGHSDTEVILHAYKQWGPSALEKFIGMFAIVIYDRMKNEVFFARDRAGVKPLFIYRDNDRLIFSSELKAFHKYPEIDLEIDPNAVSAFLQFGHIPTPNCIYKSCFKMKPGYFAYYNLEDRSWAETQYWNVYDHYNKPKLTLSYNDALEETHGIIRSAANYRMVSDVPVGVFLSGGYDSSTVTAILQSERTDKLKTFTIAVPDIGLNEAPYAADIARHLGTDHTEIACTEEEAIEMIKDLPYYYDEPFADSSAIPTTLVSNMARKDVTVALSADGGDEIFAGYNRYDYLSRYGAKMKKLPGFVRKGIAGTMNLISADHIPVLRNKYNFHNRYEKLKGILNNPSDETIMLSLSQQFTDDQMKKMMRNTPSILDSYYRSAELKKEYYSPLSYMMAVDYQTYMLDDILQKVDRATMTASLEGREPLLDHRIIEYVAQLPDQYKYNDGIKKRLLKDIAHKYIPQELMDRPKMGFAIPIGKWLQGPLKDVVEEYCATSALAEHGLFNVQEIRKIIDRFYSGKLEYDAKVWYILMFQMWYKKWNGN